MKWIKMFEDFSDSFVNELGAICYDLTDEGCKVTIDEDSNWWLKGERIMDEDDNRIVIGNKCNISIKISLSQDTFIKRWKTVYPVLFTECIKRIEDFANRYKLKTVVAASFGDDWMTVKSPDDINSLGGTKRDFLIMFI